MTRLEGSYRRHHSGPMTTSYWYNTPQVTLIKCTGPCDLRDLQKKIIISACLVESVVRRVVLQSPDCKVAGSNPNITKKWYYY